MRCCSQKNNLAASARPGAGTFLVLIRLILTIRLGVLLGVALTLILNIGILIHKKTPSIIHS